ncbi:MAG TPA: S4 domain-containing protein [Steroidobacteraceae bacterium]|nr:S4 domain-containing protein [Steroidobacteraceae bacterium]
MSRRPARGRAALGREPAEAGERLQKALAQLGLGSRREAEAWIRAGRVSVNGSVAALGARVLPADRVSLDGRRVQQRASGAQQAYLCHRSPGEPLARRGGASAQAGASLELRSTLLERLPRSAGRRFVAVSPMPAPDGGLELVSGDGELAAQLQRAVRGLTAEFSVRVRNELDPAQLERICEGLLDDGERLAVLACTPAGGEGTNRWYTLSARGASGRAVRRLFERNGALVSRVLRTRLGPVALERALGRGQFRPLAPAELAGFLAAARGEPESETPAATARRSSHRSPRGSRDRAGPGRGR